VYANQRAREGVCACVALHSIANPLYLEARQRTRERRERHAERRRELDVDEAQRQWEAAHANLELHLGACDSYF
jgi:hypothetical protein